MTVVHPNILSKSFIVLSQTADYIPLAATVSNLAQVIFKAIMDVAHLKPTCGYFHTISEKNYLELFLKMLPLIGQFYATKEAIITGHVFHLPPQSFQNVAITHVLSGKLSLSSLPIYYLKNRTFIEHAAKAGVDVSDTYFFKNDLFIFKECLKKNPRTFFKQVNPQFVNHSEIKEMVKTNVDLLKSMPLCFQADQDLIEHAILKLADDDLYKFMASNSKAFTTHFHRISNDTVLKALKKSYKILSLIPLRTQSEHHVRAAISSNGLAIKFAAARWQNNISIVHAALEQNPMALEFVNVDNVSSALFEKCVEKNPLSWAFGSLTHQRNIELRLKAISKNSKADIRLYKAHSGNKEAMIVDLASLLFQENPFAIFTIPFPYCLNSKVLQALLDHCPHDQKQAVLQQLQSALPDSFLHRLQENNYSLYAALDTATRSTIVDPSNLSGACILLKLTEDEDSVFGHSISPSFRKISKDFMIAQKAIHASNRWKPTEAKSWQDAFAIMRRHASMAELTAIEEKYNAFYYERPFFASAQGGTVTLQEYFKQNKLYLCQIAGYIQANPTDRAVIRNLIDAFQVCAGGIMSQLSQLVETYCEFSGNPPLEYRLGKLAQRLAARSVQHCAFTTYRSNDVHVINRLAEHFNSFYLDRAVHDVFGGYAVNATHQRAFFDAFNAQSLVDEVYDECKASKTFKESLVAFVKGHSEKFAEDDFEDKRDEAEEIIFRDIKTLEERFARYEEFNTKVSVLPKEMQDIINTRIRQSGQPAMINTVLNQELRRYFIKEATKALALSDESRKEALRDLHMTHEQISAILSSSDVDSALFDSYSENPMINSVKEQFSAFRPDVALVTSSLLRLQTTLNISKEEISSKFKSRELRSTNMDHILDHIWQIAFKENAAGEFLGSSYDESGEFKKEAIALILDQTGIFTNPYAV
jgi:hypothetical protein